MQTQEAPLEDFDDIIVDEPREKRPAGAIKLRPYQTAANDSVCNAGPGMWRQLVVLATGGGKTIVAGDLVKRKIGKGQREELISQGADKIGWYNPEFEIEIERGKERASRAPRLPDSTPNVVVASKDSLHPVRVREFEPDAFDLIICDETHHALSVSYKHIFEYFGCFDVERRTPLIGITATPDRQDKKSLSEIFQRVAYRKDITELIREGHLCDVRAKRINSETDLSEVGVVQGEFDQKALAEAVDSAERNALIVQSYLKYGEGRKTILFAASVAHGQRLAEVFNENGVKSEAIWGMLDKPERRARLDRFANDESTVLSNCAVLIEGFDEPSVSCIILARPIKSPSMLLQIIGRGTRLFEGKNYCLVIDVQDKGKEAGTVAGAFGLPNNFQEDDCSLSEAAEMMRDIDPGLRDKALDMDSLRKVHERVKAGLDAEEIDILERREAEEAVKAVSELRWRKSGEGYVLHVSTKSGSDKKTLNERYVLERNDLDQLQMRWTNGEKSRVSPDVFQDEKSAFEHWDAFIQKRHEQERKLLRNDEPWLSEPASKGQLEMLFGYGRFKLETDIPPKMTKAEAGDLISACKQMENEGGPKYSFRRVPDKYRTREAKAWTGPKYGKQHAKK